MEIALCTQAATLYENTQRVDLIRAHPQLIHSLGLVISVLAEGWGFGNYGIADGFETIGISSSLGYPTDTAASTYISLMQTFESSLHPFPPRLTYNCYSYQLHCFDIVNGIASPPRERQW